jgi:hypothetical protein
MKGNRVQLSRTFVTGRDKRLIELVYRFRLLRRDQLMALAPFGSLTRANTRLAALVRARILSRKVLPIYPGKGSAQALYFLGRESGCVVSAAPELLGTQIRQVSRWDLRQVEHVVSANQVLIDALKAIECVPASTIAAFHTEPELRQLFSDRTLVPDGWFAWTELGKRFNCFLEIDLHHEGLREWREKVLRYLEYSESGLHAERLGFRSFRVLVLAKSEARLRHLRQIGGEAGRMFLFGEIGKVDAGNFFGPTWLRADGEIRVRLTEA